MRLTEGRRGIGAGVVVIIIVAFVVITGGIFYAATQPPNATGGLASSTQGSSASMSSATTSSFPVADGSSTISSSSSNSSSTSGILVEILNGSAIPRGAPGYSPDKITVIIGVNNTVTWNNTDTVPHTVTSFVGNGSLNSGNMLTGATYTYTFMTPGTYDYHCLYHAWMSGTVVVISGSASAR